MTLNNPRKRFLDTNILVYSTDLSVTNRQKHRASLEILRPSENEILCLSSQVFAEFYAVVTSRKMTANPITAQEAIGRIERFQQMPNIELVNFPNDLLSRWLELLKSHPITGANIFDIIHVATMLSHEITSIYTFNDDDFNWCPEIEIIVPDWLINQ